VQALNRIVTILRAVAEAPEGLTLSEVASAASLPSATAYRFLKDLAEEGLVERQTLTKRYRYGPGLTRLALSIKAADFMSDTEESELRALRDRWQDCFYVSALLDGDVVCIRSTETNDPVRMGIFVSIGRRLAIHSSAAAKAIMAHQPRSNVESRLSQEALERFTPHTLTNPTEILADLSQTRKRGYAVCDQEMELGVAALAVPVFDARNAVSRSVGVIALRDRILGDRRQQLLEDMHHAAAALGHALA
jgi:IclR family transcriptional regulator, acetate operon repressor